MRCTLKRHRSMLLLLLIAQLIVGEMMTLLLSNLTAKNLVSSFNYSALY